MVTPSDTLPLVRQERDVPLFQLNQEIQSRNHPPAKASLVDWFVVENEASRLYPDRTYTKSINGECP